MVVRKKNLNKGGSMKIIFIGLILVIVYGVICPYLISSNRNELVILGIFIAIFAIYFLYKWIINKFKKRRSQ